MGHEQSTPGSPLSGGEAAPPAPPPTPARRARAEVGLRYPATLEFRNPQLEWRRRFSEVLGTFLLVLAGAGAPMAFAAAHRSLSLSAAVTAPGLTVMAIILFMGAVGGAHLNPVVTIAFTLRGDFPPRRVPGYILAQVLGALAAVLFLRATVGNVADLGATIPSAHIHLWQAMLIELVLTLGLVSTILGTASAAQNVGPLAAVGVGGYIVLAGLWAAPLTGASMNPVRSLAPAIVRGDFRGLWVYLAGPTAGALIAVAFAHLLRGRGGDAGGIAAAQGR